ncbi:hypothetical protein HYW35_02225 [Candidatus Saccharibacteria bacterium]|nr:hypothetical protein [Candidatus Saccharibacteria bacterium]
MNPSQKPNIITPTVGGQPPPTSSAAPLPAAPAPAQPPPQSLPTDNVTQPIMPPMPAAAVSPQVIPAKQTPDKTGVANLNSTQNTLQIAEIRDGLAILNDGSFRAVVMCKSINFDLMNSSEREAVEFAYQGFLNSLYFPIQIYMRSQKVDLDPYLDKLDKLRMQQESMLLGVLMEDYINFLAQIAQSTNIMDKRFYIVIGYPDANADIRRALRQSTGFFTGVAELLGGTKTPHVVIDEGTLEKAKTELRNRVNSVMQGLLQCGVNSIPLDTQELIELYYEAYNPDTAANQQLGDAGDLNVPIITKGKGNAHQPHFGKEGLS